MKAFFKELYTYNHHFNQQYIDSFIQHNAKISDKSVKLLNHLINAQQIWNNRIHKTSESPGVWDIRPTAELKEIDKTNYQNSLVIIDKTDFELPISYVNSKGMAYTNTVRDILFHAVNHGTYHRGQIAADFRATGLEPLTTDYIFYKR
jgi:uncharacterized damage-inducible protein DinB